LSLPPSFEQPGLGVAQAAEEVDLELVLAVDISFSVDRFEAQTQRDGYIDALTHPSVIATIQSGMLGKIAVTYLEWSDAYYQSQLVQWTVISDEASARSFAAPLAAKPLNRAYYTSISHAIDFAVGLIDSNNYTGMRKVINISGDGRQNQGRPLSNARAVALNQGITINGLPILNDRLQPVGSLTSKEAKLGIYYNDNVIGGPGAFSSRQKTSKRFDLLFCLNLFVRLCRCPVIRPLDLPPHPAQS
jgi:hypothetical protein